MAGTIISTTLTQPLTLATYASNFSSLSITAGGAIIDSNANTNVFNGTYVSPVAIRVGLDNMTIVNAGSIISNTPNYQDIGILLNAGTAGATATIENSGVIYGLYRGVDINGAAGLLSNTGSINAVNVDNAPNLIVSNSGAIGTLFGSVADVVNTGRIGAVDLTSSTLLNGGTLAGNTSLTGGTLLNSGFMTAAGYGLKLSGGIAENLGTISSARDGVDVTESAASSFTASLLGTLVNYGVISGKYGVLVDLGGYFTNNGTISGSAEGALLALGSARNAGVISGDTFGVNLGPDAANFAVTVSLYNSGTILSSAGTGANLYAKTTLLNAGLISGAKLGAYQRGGLLINEASLTGGFDGAGLGGGTLINEGVITGATYGVQLAGTGTLINYDVISGGFDGITAGYSVVNKGVVTGANDGIFASGANVTNSGTIIGGLNGVVVVGGGGEGTVTNSGTISGSQYGAAVFTASLLNTGLISSANYGVTVQNGFLVNAGTISGASGYAVYGQSMTLAVDPGAVFVGKVANKSGKGFLDLEGAGQGDLSGIGGSITGFKSIDFLSDSWRLEGNIAGLASGQTIAGFAKGDSIILDGFSATSKLYVTGTGLELTSGAVTETIDLTGSFTTANFTVTASAAATTITVTCFAAGTHIATPTGETKVEALNIGDLVQTASGPRPIKWIGASHYAGRFIRNNEAALPIRIKANAIADGIPSRDLRLSPGHALAFDNILIHAARLLNGVTILQETEIPEITYYHIELAAHEILFAEATPTESFLGEHFRPQFHNAPDFHARYPGHTAPETPCMPYRHHGFAVHEIQSRLAARAGLAAPAIPGRLRGYIDSITETLCTGWAQDISAPHHPVLLDIFANGARLGQAIANIHRADVRAAHPGAGHHGFEFPLPPGASNIEIRRAQDGAALPPAARQQAA